MIGLCTATTKNSLFVWSYVCNAYTKANNLKNKICQDMTAIKKQETKARYDYR